MLDVEGYPEQSSFMIFTDSENLPRELFDSMKNLQDFSLGNRIAEMIATLTGTFATTLTRSTATPATSASQAYDEDSEMTDVDDEDDNGDFGFDSDAGDIDHLDDDDDDDDLGGSPFDLPAAAPSGTRGRSLTGAASDSLRRRIKQDLRKVRAAGFRVGILSGLEPSSISHIVSMSIRARRLGLADEALATWGIQASDYIVLLYRIDGQYQTFETVVDRPHQSSGLSFCVGKCSSYKPDLADVTGAFVGTQTSPDALHRASQDANLPERPKFGNIAVSKSLGTFLKECFVKMVKFRSSPHLSWDNANSFILAQQGRTDANAALPGASASTSMAGAPPPRWGDELADSAGGPKSLPLLAMQCAMHYLTECTRYCLVCHRPVDEDFGALKPYVCSNPLCLFQYVSFGFGPSLEHEIVTQPRVVDLLVSFCYNAVAPTAVGYSRAVAAPCPIREFPSGLRMEVPDFSPTAEKIEGRLSRDTTRFSLADPAMKHRLCKLAEGRWVAVCPKPKPTVGAALFSVAQQVLPQTHLDALTSISGPTALLFHHARVRGFDQETSTLLLQPMAKSTGGVGTAAPALALKDADLEFYLVPYDADFDNMTDGAKMETMHHILETLPSVEAMVEYLEDHPRSTLQKMEAVSPAAASLLQWIVASNRSYIVQMDTAAGDDDGTSDKTPGYIEGMGGYAQFRFAQGSPDKEERFNRALESAEARLGLRHPTLFAWHGSGLSNWHSILRTGLDFSKTAHGRAYGDGVYFSNSFVTSQGYSGGNPYEVCRPLLPFAKARPADPSRALLAGFRPQDLVCHQPQRAHQRS